ncbi:hypothetical protein [Scytonema sp. HK-05]|uniref:hypothetical protein n=1 Tax=Scytonema sp. HK-05 TaxID=1137095 RepID=UPI000AC8BBE4|nr:hypothetical protein [Scytonema sp. HK-05]
MVVFTQSNGLRWVIFSGKLQIYLPEFALFVALVVLLWSSIWHLYKTECTFADMD